MGKRDSPVGAAPLALAGARVPAERCLGGEGAWKRTALPCPQPLRGRGLESTLARKQEKKSDLRSGRMSRASGIPPLGPPPSPLLAQGCPPRGVSAARGHGSALRFHAHNPYGVVVSNPRLLGNTKDPVLRLSLLRFSGKRDSPVGATPLALAGARVPAERCLGGEGAWKRTALPCPQPLRGRGLESTLARKHKRPSLTTESSAFLGQAGFEPTTPCTPCKCATRLRYCPFLFVFGLATGDGESIHPNFCIVKRFFS